MQALRIQEIKSFMSSLLVHDTFRSFETVEADITTFAAFHIDGLCRKDYFDNIPSAGDPDRPAVPSGRFIPWTMLRPCIYELIRGKHTPGKIRIVFRLNDEAAAAFTAPFSIPQENIGGLYLNVLYENGAVMLTTGVSLRVFSIDRSLEHAWDEHIQSFLHKAGLAAVRES